MQHHQQQHHNNNINYTGISYVDNTDVTTNDQHILVFIVETNLTEIDAAVSAIYIH